MFMYIASPRSRPSTLSDKVVKFYLIFKLFTSEKS